MTPESEPLATQMWSTARVNEQCVQAVPDDSVASEVRQLVRRLAREDGIRIRTARMGDSVVVVRLDAQIWKQDATTMRRKLTIE
jgi:hypothetical protein